MTDTLCLLIKPASSGCNLGCRYCFYADVARNRTVKNYGMMREETLDVVVKRAFAEPVRHVWFVFQGGEPMLAGLSFFRLFSRLCEKYNTRKIDVGKSIQTNGTLLTDEWCAYLKENDYLAGLSLDGPEEIHDVCRGKGTFAAVERAVDLLEKHAVEFNVLSVITRYAAENPEKVLAFFLRKGLRYLQFVPCLEPFDGAETDFALQNEAFARFWDGIFDVYYKAFLQNEYFSIRDFDNYVRILSGGVAESCAMQGVCGDYFVVEANGDVFPCDFYVTDAYTMGNVENASFSEMDAAHRERFVLPSREVATACKTCTWFALCRGGCRRNRLVLPDGKLGQNRFCEAYRRFFRKNYGKLCHMAVLSHQRR